MIAERILLLWAFWENYLIKNWVESLKMKCEPWLFDWILWSIDSSLGGIPPIFGALPDYGESW